MFIGRMSQIILNSNTTRDKKKIKIIWFYNYK